MGASASSPNAKDSTDCPPASAFPSVTDAPGSPCFPLFLFFLLLSLSSVIHLAAEEGAAGASAVTKTPFHSHKQNKSGPPLTVWLQQRGCLQPVGETADGGWRMNPHMLRRTCSVIVTTQQEYSIRPIKKKTVFLNPEDSNWIKRFKV